MRSFDIIETRSVFSVSSHLPGGLSVDEWSNALAGFETSVTWCPAFRRHSAVSLRVEIVVSPKKLALNSGKMQRLARRVTATATKTGYAICVTDWDVIEVTTMVKETTETMINRSTKRKSLGVWIAGNREIPGRRTERYLG